MAKKVMNVVPFEFDSRLVEWNIKHNLINRDQLKTYLNTLPDDSNNMETLSLDDEGKTETPV